MNPFRAGFAWTQAYVRHPDVLAEESNWVAVLIGTHLPLWPLYILAAAGRQSWPTCIWTVSMTPVFLAIPLLSRRSSRLGRVAMILAGITNTALTRWVLGPNCGTELFYVPCAVLAAILFRRAERWTMLVLSSTPLLIWYLSRSFAGLGLHHYDSQGAQGIYSLNIISVSVLITAFGWLQAQVYGRMEGSGV